MKLIKRLLADHSGASAAEYALILAIIGVAIAAAAIGLGTAIGDRMTQASECISAGTVGACGG